MEKDQGGKRETTCTQHILGLMTFSVLNLKKITEDKHELIIRVIKYFKFIFGAWIKYLIIWFASILMVHGASKYHVSNDRTLIFKKTFSFTLKQND